MSRSSLEKSGFALGSLVKEGRLLKRGEYIKNWRSRYMMLYSGGIMYGYKNNPADAPPNETEEPLNEFDLRHGHVKATEKSSKSGCTFTIGFLQVSHYIERHFSAESEADRNEWIEAIHRVCHSGESDVILPIPRFAHTTSGGTTSGTGSQHDYTNESSATSSPYLNNHAATSNTPLTSSDDSLSRNQATHLSQSQHSSASNLRSTHQSLPVYPTYDDFDKLKVLGQGSFGKVMLVREKCNGQLMAMKILKKSTLVAKNEVSHTLTEKHVLQSVSHPFLTQLIYAFQDKFRLFFVMEYAHGGELFYHLGKERRFEEPKARFYAAEIVLGIGHLHKHNILYRDIKLENIMIDHEGHIKITDFGLCKKGIDDAQTFCGTPEYLAPEVIALRRDFDIVGCTSDDGSGDSDEDIVYGRAVDWWALGIVLYEMLFGRLPFFGSNQMDAKSSQNELYRKICQAPLKFPQPRPINSAQGTRTTTPVSDAAKNILLRFLEKDPNKRLGARHPPEGLNDIKQHSFFYAFIDWDALESKKIPPPFVPEKDEEYFEKMFTDKPIELTPPERDSRYKSKHQDELFKDFNK